MAKMFRTSGTGSQQQTLDTTDEKIKIYATDTALDTDLTNIPDGEIVATKESAGGGGSGYVGEIPLGTWASFESDTAPNNEWIQAGTTFDANVYPALAMMLGGNTVPERFDHNRQSNWEEIVPFANHPISDIFPYTVTKDGLYSLIIETSENRIITVNNVEVARTSTTARNNTTFSANKGDIISISGSTGSLVYGFSAAYFEHPMFIKATPTSNDSDYEGTLNSIREFYVRNNTYSTEERATGGVWIDGKPIYRLVAVCLSQGSTSATSKYNGVDMTNYNMSELLHASIMEIGETLPKGCFEGCIYRVEMQSNKKMVCFFPSGQGWDAVSSGNTRYIVVEYTKTTD